MKLKKKISTLFLLFSLLTVPIIALDSGDSLISRNFFENAYNGFVEQIMIERAIEELDPIYQEKLSQLQELRGQVLGSGIQSTALSTNNFGLGTNLIFTEGNLFVPSEGAFDMSVTGTVVNLTTGEEHYGGILTIGNQYLVAENSGAEVKTLSSTGKVSILGTYRVENLSSVLPFYDVSSEDWFYDAVAFVEENGLFSGTATDQFSPNSTMNRAMMMTVLFRLAGSPFVEMDYATNRFLDVELSDWFEPYVRWGASQSLTSGVGDDLFAPTHAVTRQQVLAMLYPFAKEYMGITMSVPSNVLEQYSDSDTVAVWAEESFSWAVSYGLLRGIPDNNTLLKGNQEATRSEVAIMLTNFCQIFLDY